MIRQALKKTATPLNFGFVLLLFGVAGHAPIAMGQATGTFTPTGNLTGDRWFHTATLLKNGKVLIAGGRGFRLSLDPLDTAELYDPSTGTFFATGSMSTARVSHTATLLRNGSVLIAGGEGKGGIALASAEIYDPSTGSFASTGNMSTSHYRATLLSNGKVLMGPPATDGSAELYDPSTGTFTTTGGYAHIGTGSVFGIDGLFGSTATLLPDGRVLITSEPTGALYVPGTGTFSLTGAMKERAPYIVGRTATLLTNGKVLVAGGDVAFDEDTDTVFASAELYDPSSGTFTATGNMTTAREQHTATLLPDGSVLIAGGGSDPAAELYDPASGTFSRTGPMSASRFGNTATPLADGTVLVAGGQRYPVFDANAAEIYHPQSSVWQAAVTAMKTAAGSDSQNFWQWAYYWQYLPAFQGAPAGFGVVDSISLGVMEQIIVAGGGNGFQMVSAEQWALYYRQAASISASPNPCTLSGSLCTSYITWSTSGISNAQVWVTVGSGPESLFASGVSCSGTACAAPWIQGGGFVYTFTLYDCSAVICTSTGHGNAPVLSSIRVTAQGRDATVR